MSDLKNALGRAYGPYMFFKERLKEIDLKTGGSSAKLSTEDHWRREYYKYPHLILETNENISQRFYDIFLNTIDITKEGRIKPRFITRNSANLTQALIEIIEECNWRGNITKQSLANISGPLEKDFEDGLPVG
jgi:hypothetical protein